MFKNLIERVRDRIRVWFKRKQIRQDAATLAAALVGEPNNPISVYKSPNFKYPKRLSQKQARRQLEEMAGKRVADPNSPGYMLGSWDTKTPGFLHKQVFNDKGECVQDIIIPIKEGV